MKKVFEVEFVAKEKDVTVEDGGRAKILETDQFGDPHLFVRIQSWNEEDEVPEHPLFDSLIGKKIKVIIMRE